MKYYKVGLKVIHETFGRGEIISLYSNSISNVVFASTGEIKMIHNDFLEICNSNNLYEFTRPKPDNKNYEKIFQIEKYNYINQKKAQELFAIKKIPTFKYSEWNKGIAEHNERYIKSEIENNPQLFQPEGYELDNDQKRAIITDEESQLIIAGAGCGKTSMLIGKINYLIHKGIPANKILILSYTTKTVEDINDRLKKLNIQTEAKTFHALACSYVNKKYDVDITVKNILAGIINFEQRKIGNDTENLYERMKNSIKLYLKNIMQRKELNEIKELFIKFVATFHYQPDLTEYTKGEATLKDYSKQKFSTLKDLIENYENNNTTIKGEKVKSLAEAKIANFLFLSNINYKYEQEYKAPYIASTAEKNKNKHYNPDFHIKTMDGKDIWVEHFGVTYDEQGPHAYWLNSEDEACYIQQMKEKRQTHRQNQTILIETNSSQLKDGTLFKHLKQELEKYGVVFKERTEEEIQNYLNKLKTRDKNEKYTNYLERYINLFKSQSKFTSFEELKKYLLQKYSYKTVDIKIFFSLITKLYSLYEKILQQENSIDFNDMINKAIDVVKSGEKNFDYDYILVDEYQDITNRRYDFLRTIQEKTQAKIFCVGDDWQSIYGFTGSDVSLFTLFEKEKMFPHAGKPLEISQTHRNSDKLTEIAGNFIMKNENQIKKTLQSCCKKYKEIKHPIKTVYYHHSKIDTECIKGCNNLKNALETALDNIIDKIRENETICIIGRYNIEKYSLKGENFEYFEDSQKVIYKKHLSLNIKFSTIHKAKGLEYDYIIFLDMREAPKTYSFPAQITDDYKIKPLLKKSDHYPYAEERRMFYVALTRARQFVYLLVSEDYPSCFFEEIKDKTEIINDTLAEYCKKTGKNLCPDCKKDILTSDNFHKLICRHCNFNVNDKGTIFTNKTCPKCGNKLCISYTSQNFFIGHSNYPSSGIYSQCRTESFESFIKKNPEYCAIIKIIINKLNELKED